jgi:hypothetical protein
MKISIFFLTMFFFSACFSQSTTVEVSDKGLDIAFKTENISVKTPTDEVSYQSPRLIRVSKSNLSVSFPCSEGSRSDYATWFGLRFVARDGCIRSYETPLGDYLIEVDTCKLQVCISANEILGFSYKETYH